jgi:hypothetical protein
LVSTFWDAIAAVGDEGGEIGAVRQLEGQDRRRVIGMQPLQLGHGPTLSRWHADAINLSLDSPELSCGHAG